MSTITEVQRRTIEQVEVDTALAQAEFSDGIQTLETTIEQLFRHLEGMAGHIVALEGVVTELAATAGLDEEKILKAVQLRVGGPEGKGGDPKPAQQAVRELIGSGRLN